MTLGRETGEVEDSWVRDVVRGYVAERSRCEGRGRRCRSPGQDALDGRVRVADALAVQFGPQARRASIFRHVEWFIVRNRAKKDGLRGGAQRLRCSR
jgi:hypothetical protein